MTKIEISKERRYSYGKDGNSIVFAWCIEQFGRPVPFGSAACRWNTDTYTGFYFRD